jgi:hypothetical protein
MSLYQRRLASSTYAMRHSLESRAKRLEGALKRAQDLALLAPPELPDPEELEEMEESERERLEEMLEAITLAGNAQQARQEVEELRVLASRALAAEDTGAEAKLSKLKELLHQEGFFDHPEKRLLIFTALPEAASWLNEQELVRFLEETRRERMAEIERIAAHVQLSLTELLQRADEEIGRAAAGVDQKVTGAEGRFAQTEARHSELLARRERRRKDLEQQRSLSLRAVERFASVLVLPHPERGTPEVRRLQPDLETEATAMSVVMEHERSQGRQVYDVHEKNLGYGVTSLDLTSGELRLIEVKGIGAATGTILLTPNERRVAEDRRDCYWLYVVTNSNASPQLQPPIKDPARFEWNEVTKVAHYYLTVPALTAQSSPETKT